MLETGVQHSESAENTRERLLEAAGEVFAEKGFREATIREICGRAGANIASVNYHFGGKERLYAAVLKYADDIGVARYFRGGPEMASASAEDRLRWFVLQFMRKVFDQDRPAWHQRFMAREMIDPTAALDEVIDKNIKARSQVLQGIVRELLGPEVNDRHVQRGTASVVGQCLFYWHCRVVIPRVLPQLGFSPGNVESIAAHIAEFSLHALKGLRDGGVRP